MEELRLAMQAEQRQAQFRRLQCVWLRVQHDLSTEAVAKVTGLSVSQVWRIWSQYFRGSLAAISKPKGGRRNEHLTVKEEAEFLEAFVEQAQKGVLLTARMIKISYEQKVGRRVAESTVCRMLRRHDWKRVSTRPPKPLGDAGAREELNSRGRWLPPGCPGQDF
jgi:transposase